MTAADLQIVELAHVSWLGPLLAGWHAREWSHLYEGWDSAAAEAEFAAMSVPGTIPTTWVAFVGDQRRVEDVAGSVSLALTDDLPGFESVSPWLVSLFVLPQHRSHGIAGALVDHLLDQARTMGVDRVHLFTAGQEAYYLARGWRTIEYAKAGGHRAAVMVRHTDPWAARRAVSSRWVGDPDFDGAYAYLRRGATPADRDALQGEVAPGLYLAGEAGSRRYPGTLHGAYLSGEAAAGALLERLGPQDGPTDAVVVIGAGVAGLAAARRLHDGGRSVMVFEAKAYLGGRAGTDWNLGVPVHIGAAWLHGQHGNPLAALGAGGQVSTWDAAGHFVVGHGPVDADRARRAQEELRRRLAEAAHLSRQGQADPASPDPAYAETAFALLERLEQDPDYGLTATDVALLRTWVRTEVESLYAAPSSELSLRYGAEPFELAGQDILVSQPWEPLLQRFASDLDVRLSHRATLVAAEAAADSDASGWRVTFESNPEPGLDPGSQAPPLVRTVRAAAVMVTVPIGVLRSERLRFDPPLPEPVRVALGRLGAGPVGKVSFRFDTAFWAPYPAFWLADSLSSGQGHPFALWFDVSCLAGVPMLCAFAVGEAALWAEAASEDELCRRADELLAQATVGGSRPTSPHPPR